MANMSYCRFQNTSGDLQDCIDDIDERLGNNLLDEYDEKLSHEELRAMRDMVEKARYFFEIGEDFLEQLEDED